MRTTPPPRDSLAADSARRSDPLPQIVSPARDDSTKLHPAPLAPLDTVTAVIRPEKWKRSAFDLYEIDDLKLLREFWTHSRLPGTPEEGAHQILIFRGDSLPQAYLLRAGTQVAKLADTTLPLVRRKVRSGALSRGGSAAGLLRNFWNPTDPLQPYLWNTGVEIAVRGAVTGVKRSVPTVENHYDFTFSQRPLPWIVTEVGGHLSRTGGSRGGGLRRNLLNPNDSVPLLSTWESFSPWWHAAIGVPGIKWEVSLSNRLLPEYYWLDPNGGEGSYRAGGSARGFIFDPNDTTNNIKNDGSVMREWKVGGDPAPSRGNLAHTLRLRAGNLRYDAHFDEDVYLSVIHRAMFDELPAPFGQWGFGFITARGAAHTLLRLDLFPWRLGFGKPVEHTNFRLSFLRVNIAYRDLQNFHVGVTTSLLLDSRILRPGDKSP